MNYTSAASNALEETCVISNANNLVLRQELRNSKLQSHNVSSESSLKNDDGTAFLDQTYHSAGAIGPSQIDEQSEVAQVGHLNQIHLKTSAKANAFGLG